VIEIAVLKTFDSANHRASVQLVGSLTTYLDDIPVSVAIAPSSLVIGNRVLLAIPGGNIRDAVIIATWPQGDALPAHASRHVWGGADPVAPFPMALVKFPVFLHFESLDLYNKYLGGSGSLADSTLFRLSLTTGLTSGSFCRVSHREQSVFSMYPVQIVVFNAQIRSPTNQRIRIYVAPIENPSETTNHVGFLIVNNSLQATNANGTTQTVTPFRTFTGPFSAQLMFITRFGSIEFYESFEYGHWTLVATHTTNLPTPGFERFVFHIENTAAEDKGLILISVMAGRF
jgi:hypothetical protein